MAVYDWNWSEYIGKIEHRDRWLCSLGIEVVCRMSCYVKFFTLNLSLDVNFLLFVNFLLEWKTNQIKQLLLRVN